MSKLSVIIPVYYNADTLMECYEDLRNNALNMIDGDYELILVDDGSEDASWDVCKKIAGMDENVRLIRLSRNFGSHAACYAGLAICTGDCAVIKSADSQEPSSLVLEMYKRWSEGNRVVLAVREGREESLSQAAFANLYYGLV